MKSIYSQVSILSWAGIKSRYRNSFFGFLWVVISPLSTYAAQVFIFKTVFQIQISNYSVFLLFNLLPWILLAQSVEMCTTLFQYNNRILKSNIAKPISLIISKVNENVLNFFSTLAIALFVFHFTNSGLLDLKLVLLSFLAFIPVYIVTVSLCFALAALNLIFYDTKFLTSFVLGIAFYLTPIVYPESLVPENYRIILSLNPLTYLFRPFNYLTQSGSLAELSGSLACSFLMSAAFVAITAMYWRKVKNDAYTRL